MTGQPSQHQDASATPNSAAQWDARLRAPGCQPKDREAFERWRLESDANSAEFAQLQSALKALQAASGSDPQLRAIRDRARGVSRDRRRMFRIAASLVAVVVAGFGGYGVFMAQRPSAPPPAVYRTASGERSTIRLGDGSVVTMSAMSEVRVAYSRKQRDLTLLKGEAMFEVAKNADRPFVVVANQRAVTAVGTAFDVKIAADMVRVTMVEGKVRVDNVLAPKKTAQGTTLVAGQRLTMKPGSSRDLVEQADLTKDLAWLEGRMVFDGETLEGAVAEVNRYTDAPITIGDASLKTLPVSGMFRTNQPGRFVDALESYYPIRADRASSGEVTLLRR